MNFWLQERNGIFSACLLSQPSSVAWCGGSYESLSSSRQELGVKLGGYKRREMRIMWMQIEGKSLHGIHRGSSAACAQSSGGNFTNHLGTTFGKQLLPILGTEWDSKARWDSLVWVEDNPFSLYADLQLSNCPSIWSLIELAFWTPFVCFFASRDIKV